MVKEFHLEKALATEGWMNPVELRFLAEQANKAGVIFEIGCYKGKSTRAMADNTDGRIYAIDSWEIMNVTQNGMMPVDRDQTFNQFYCNMFKHIESGRVILCPISWEKFEPPELADFIFIDGDHRYDHIKHDIQKALAFLKFGGVIAGHDYRFDFPDVKKAVHETFGDLVNVIDSIWWVNV